MFLFLFLLWGTDFSEFVSVTQTWEKIILSKKKKKKKKKKKNLHNMRLSHLVGEIAQVAKKHLHIFLYKAKQSSINDNNNSKCSMW